VFNKLRTCLASAIFYPICGGKRRFIGRWLRFAAHETGGRWLDLCCGSGEITLRLAAMAREMGEVIGADIDRRAMLKTVSGAGPSGVGFVTANAAALPFPDARFDRVLVSLALHHLPPVARRRALREAYRVLAPEGRLLVLEYNLPASGLPRLLARFYARIDLSREAYPMLMFGLLRGAIDEAGFRVVRRELMGSGVLQLLEAVK